jgi:hypothetical protein
VQERWVAWSGDGENLDVCCGAHLCLSTPIPSFDCIPTGNVFLFSMNRKSESLVLCKMDITNNSIDLMEIILKLQCLRPFSN